jgi:hypothetical protein
MKKYKPYLKLISRSVPMASCHLLQKMNKTFVCSMNNTIGILITLKYAKTILSSKKYYVVLVILDFSVEGIRASRLSPPSLAMGTDLEINLR